MKTVMPVKKAVEELLEKSGIPMHYKEITKIILHQCELHGETPHETVRSLIGTDPRFIRVAEGVYALSKWKHVKPARFAKDIIYNILKSKGEARSLYDLGVKVLEERKFIGSPKMIARNAIRYDIRFHLDKSSELVQLVEWKKTKTVSSYKRLKTNTK